MFYVAFLIFVLSLLVKLHTIDAFVTYNSETAQHYLEIVSLQEGKILLQGPLTSKPWLRLSSAPYYLFYPLLYMTSFHPAALHYLWVLTSCATVLISYSVVSSLYGKQAGVIASWLYFTSANILSVDRNTGFFPFIIPLSYILIWQTGQVFFRDSKKQWALFFTISCMFTLHASGIVLLPFYTGALLLSKKYNLRQALASVFAFLLPQTPLLLNELSTNFSSLANLALWVPYKVVSFVSGKTLGVGGSTVVDQTVEILIEFLKNTVFPSSAPTALGIGIFILLLLSFVALLKKRAYTLDLYLMALLLFGITALLIHKNPPQHYFVPFMVVPLVLAARFFDILFTHKSYRIMSVLSLFVLSVVNSKSIFSPEYMFALPTSTLQQQESVASLIYTDIKNSEYQLYRIGDFDNYPKRFQENYEFLLWRLGNRPRSSSKSIYYIVENEKGPPIDTPVESIGSVNTISIYKNLR